MTKCPPTLILNKIVTVLQCMKNGTLRDTLWCLLWSPVNLIMSQYWTCMLSHLPIPFAAFRKYPKALWCSPNTRCDWPTKKCHDDWQVSHQLQIRLAYSWRWRYWWVERRNSGKRALCREGQLWDKCQGQKSRASITSSFRCQTVIREKNLAPRLL